jgi:hypothetical protein
MPPASASGARAASNTTSPPPSKMGSPDLYFLGRVVDAKVCSVNYHQGLKVRGINQLPASEYDALKRRCGPRYITQMKSSRTFERCALYLNTSHNG